MKLLERLTKFMAKPVMFSWFAVGSPKAPRCLK